MRIFLIWADGCPELAELMFKLKNNYHDIVYWVGYTGAEVYNPPGTVFHSYLDAIEGKPAAGIKINEFLPPGEALISQLYHVESLSLSMMNRLFDNLCVGERRHIYYGMLRYWLGVLKKYQPELIIFPNTPHFVYDYIIYELAHLLNIKTIAFDDTRIPGRLLYFDDYRQGSELLCQRLIANKGKDFLLDDLSDDIKEYYKPRAQKSFQSTPPYIIDQKSKYVTWHWPFWRKKIIKSIIDLTIFSRTWRYFIQTGRQTNWLVFRTFLNHLRATLKNNLCKEYRSVQTTPDFNKKFIYVPLQTQPERTTSPQGEMFEDQILVLEILAAALPNDWLIYTKEHPIQWLRSGVFFSSSRYQGYYKRIAKIEKVRLVPVETNTYELIDKAQIVSAVTGSAGWEAVLRSKPSMVFGYVWYSDCPGVFKVKDVESCRNVLAEIQKGFKIEQQSIVNYLKSFEEATIRGFIAPTAGNASSLSKEESMSNIAKFILSIL